MSDVIPPLPSSGIGSAAALEEAPRFDPEMFPAGRRPWWQFLLDHNPCLLLSTVLMLLGCYLINSSIAANSGDLAKLLTLLGVINVYEACIIPLGLLLIRRARATARDGLWLLLFEILFLVNGTFLNVDPSLIGGDHAGLIGWSLNFVLLTLAIVKAGIIFRGLGIPLGLRTWGFLALQLSIIYGLPIYFAYASVDGVMSQQAMYGLWWLVGLLPLLYDVVAATESAPAESERTQRIVRRAYLMAPWVMLVIHLRFSHWAHHADFSGADLSPVLFGLAMASSRVKLRGPARVLAMLLPLVAFLLSLVRSAGGLTILAPSTGVLPALSAPLVSLVGLVLTYAYMHSGFAAAVAVGIGGISLVTYLGRNVVYVSMGRSLSLAGEFRTFAINLIPQTATVWGIVAVVAAFVLLAVGGFRSLRRAAPVANVRRDM